MAEIPCDHYACRGNFACRPLRDRVLFWVVELLERFWWELTLGRFRGWLWFRREHRMFMETNRGSKIA